MSSHLLSIVIDKSFFIYCRWLCLKLINSKDKKNRVYFSNLLGRVYDDFEIKFYKSKDLSLKEILAIMIHSTYSAEPSYLMGDGLCLEETDKIRLQRLTQQRKRMEYLSGLTLQQK